MAVAQRKMTYDELCQMLDDGVLYELLEGELVTRASPTPAHQQMVSRLSRLFAPVEDAEHGTFYPGPIDVVFDQHNMTLPDGIFVTAARQGIVTGTGVLGAPDVVMEILSPTSIERDWSQKFVTYQRFGVRSYWIFDLALQHLHRFDLVGGRYAPEVVLGPGDVRVAGHQGMNPLAERDEAPAGLPDSECAVPLERPCGGFDLPGSL